MSSYYEKFLATGEVKCIDEEIPFEIPQGWEWSRMGSIGDWGAGATPAKGNTSYYGGNILWLRTGELNNSIVNDTEIKITDKALKECSLRLNKAGDVLIAMYGATIGKVAIAGCELTTNQACCACTPIGIFNYYLFYFLMGNQVDFIKKGEGGAQPNISREKLVAHLMPIPPIQEQHRIVERIKDVLPLTDKYAHSQIALDELNRSINGKLKKSILQEAIQGRLVPQVAEEGTAQELLEQIKLEKQKLVKEGNLKKSALSDSVIYKGDDNKYYEQVGKSDKEITEEIAFDLPNGWSWCRLKDICSIFTGATFKKEETVTTKEGVRILRGGNISPFELRIKDDDIFLTKDKVKEDIILKENDILTPAVTSLENIGKMVRVNSDMPNTTVGGFVFIIRLYLKNQWLSKYILYLLSSPFMIDFMKSITNKSGQAFYNIGKERLSTALLPIPSLAEQHRIVAQIEKLFEQLR